MKSVTTILPLVLLLALGAYSLSGRNEAHAQNNSTQAIEGAPTLDQILDRYVQTLGGKAVFEKLTSRVTIQSSSRSDGDAKVEIYEKAPNKRLIITTFGDSRKIASGFDGVVAWVQSADGGLHEMKDNELSLFRHNSDFYREIRLREVFPHMTLKGKVTTEGRTTYLIEAPTATGLIEKMYFDTQSGLLVRRVRQAIALIRESDDAVPEARTVDIVLDYDDFRAVDGVKLPFKIRQSTPAFVSTIEVKEIKHGVAIDDAKFRKPAS